MTVYTSSLSLSLDAGNTSSYDAGVGGTVWNDLSGNGLNAYLVNGPTWNTAGYFSLDGTNDYIYVLEFKLNKDGETALQQIKDKGYAEKYYGDSREKILLGINFSSEQKTVDDWKYEILK